VKISIAFNTFVLYALTFAVGLAAAWRHAVMPSLGTVAPVDLSLPNVLIFLGVFTVFTFVMARFVRVARRSLSVFLVIALLSGSQFVFASWLTGSQALIGALALVLLLGFLPIVLVHDLAIVFGIGGVSAVLGLSMTPLIACVLLAAMSVYDIISVYRTRHMVALAQHMMSSGAVFGFLVPARLSGFFMRRRDALEAREVMMLGSGDIGLPLVLATSAVSQSIGAAVLVGGFALIGLTLMHWMFARQERPMPMAALPPIAMSAIVGYVLAVALGI
jgi:presenilin-like A22 family membrane protease